MFGDRGQWVKVPFQVERWGGGIFDVDVKLISNHNTVKANDIIAIDISDFNWEPGQRRRIRTRKKEINEAAFHKLSRLELRFDKGWRSDTERMMQHNMPDGRPISLDPRREIYFIDNAQEENYYRKGYLGFCVNDPIQIGMPDGNQIRSTGYLDVILHIGNKERLAGKMKCVSTANMADPQVTGGCAVVPYHVFDCNDNQYDLCSGYPSWQMFTKIGPLYAYPEKIDYLVDGPVRKLLRYTTKRYFLDANQLLQRPCDNTTI